MIGYATALMTAFYMFRLMFLTFHGQPRMSHEVEHHIHESPKSMTVPLIILAICSVSAGWLGWPHSLGGSNRFEKFLEPVFAREAPVLQAEGEAGQLAAGEKEEEHTSPVGIFPDVLLRRRGGGWIGHGVAGLSRCRTKATRSPSRQQRRPLYTVLLNKYYVDEAYDYAFTGRRKVGDVRLGVMGLGEASSWFDSHVIDGTVNGAGWMTRLSGNDFQLVGQVDHRRIAGKRPAILSRMLSYPARLLQWGLVQWYALVMVIGLVGFVFYYAVAVSKLRLSARAD